MTDLRDNEAIVRIVSRRQRKIENGCILFSRVEVVEGNVSMRARITAPRDRFLRLYPVGKTRDLKPGDLVKISWIEGNLLRTEFRFQEKMP